jgi:hypothetical protein
LAQYSQVHRDLQAILVFGRRNCYRLDTRG